MSRIAAYVALQIAALFFAGSWGHAVGAKIGTGAASLSVAVGLIVYSGLLLSGGDK